MSELKTRIINEIIRIEGGYVDNPDDSGGATKYGITEAIANKYGYSGDMKDLLIETAFEIYSDLYWNSLRLSIIEKISPKIAEELADTGVNLGINQAAKFLQRSLNALNKKGILYPDIAVDGWLGDESLRSFAEYIAIRGKEGETILLRILNCLQGAFYISLAEKREKDETFIYGWFKNRIKFED